MLIFISCVTRNEYYFEKSGTIEFIDFEKLNSPSEGEFKVPMRNYNYIASLVNTKFGDFNLYVVDVDNNNEYSNNNDAIFIQFPTEKDLKSPDISNKLKKENFFSINNKPFSITDINKKNGKHKFNLSFNKISIDSINFNNRTIDALPNLSFLDYKTNTKLHFKDYLTPNKYTYVEFWATWCSPCIQKLPKIKELNEKYKSKLNIVSVHSDKSILLKEIDTIIATYKMDWINGVSTTEVNEKFNYGKAPAGYLFNDKGELLIGDATPKLIDEYFKTKKPY